MKYKHISNKHLKSYPTHSSLHDYKMKTAHTFKKIKVCNYQHVLLMNFYC